MRKSNRQLAILIMSILAAVCVAAVFPVQSEAVTTTTKLKTPVIKTLKKADNGFTVISSKNSKASGFQIKYSTSIRFKNSKYKSFEGNKLEATISGLKEYKRYYVMVRSYKIVKGKKNYSEWSKRRRVTTSCKPFDGYYAYTRYAQTTLYKKRSVLSGRIILWYNTKVYVSGVRKIAGVKWIRVSYNGKQYHIPATSLSQKLKKEASQYVYFGKTQLEKEIIDKALGVFFNWPTKYDYTHKAPIAVPDSGGKYPFDCSALASYILNSTMQKYCPAYNASRGVIEEYYTGSLINSGYDGSEFNTTTVCTGRPVLSKLRAGDILFFRQSHGYPVDHVGIYLGSGEFIQSNGIYSRYPGDRLGGVNIAPLKGKYESEFRVAKRFIPQSPDEFKVIDKVLVRKTAITVYSDVKCTEGNEKETIKLPEGAKVMELRILYIGNRYYNDDKVSHRCAFIEYEDASGTISYGFVKISENSVIRDKQTADQSEGQPEELPAGQPEEDPPAEED